MEEMFYDRPSDYKALLPEMFQDVLEVDEIAKSVNVQLDRLLQAIRQNVQNRSVMSAEGEGISRWEKILGVTTPLNSSDQSRREALKAKLMTKPPINLGALREVIQTYMGVSVNIEVDEYQILVRYRGESRVADLKPFYQTLYELIPAVLLVSIVYFYLTWDGLMEKDLDFDGLTAKDLDWYSFERAKWLDAAP